MPIDARVRAGAAPVLALSLALSTLACSTGGRRALPPPGEPLPAPVELEADPLERNPDLLLLHGRYCEVFYTPGTLDRAAALQQRLDVFVEAVMGMVPKQAGLLIPRLRVLDSERWQAAGIERPWGLPGEVGELEFAVPATGDPATVELARRLTGGVLPALPGEPLIGTADEAASLVVADAVLQAELGGAWARAAGIRGERPWIEGLVGHAVARLAWEQTDPGGMPAIADLFDRIAARRGGGGARPLGDYRHDLAVEERLAFDADLLRGADLLWVKKGNTGLRRWLAASARSGLRLSEADLRNLAPGLNRWIDEGFAR
jgi:hypothetical protein